MRHPSPLALLATCAALGGGAVAAGCGGDDEDAAEGSAMGAEPAMSAAASADRIEIADFKYGPEAVTVAAGTEVTWTNRDEAAHTATADDGSFDTGTLNLDDTGKATFDEPGTYSYYCRFHPFMKATVEVR